MRLPATRTRGCPILHILKGLNRKSEPKSKLFQIKNRASRKRVRWWHIHAPGWVVASKENQVSTIWPRRFLRQAKPSLIRHISVVSVICFRWLPKGPLRLRDNLGVSRSNHCNPFANFISAMKLKFFKPILLQKKILVSQRRIRGCFQVGCLSAGEMTGVSTDQLWGLCEARNSGKVGRPALKWQ